MVGYHFFLPSWLVQKSSRGDSNTENKKALNMQKNFITSGGYLLSRYQLEKSKLHYQKNSNSYLLKYLIKQILFQHD